jgi:hypothetical protein
MYCIPSKKPDEKSGKEVNQDEDKIGRVPVKEKK